MYEAGKNQDNLVDRFVRSGQPDLLEVQCRGASNQETNTRFSFFDLVDFGKFVRTYFAPLGYIRTARTHLGHHEIPRFEERIKRRRDQALKF